MAGVRNALQSRVTIVDMLLPQSTATLGLESGTFDTRSYAKGSRFIAYFSVGAMTEGTLTLSVVNSATSGGTYTAVSDTYGTLATTSTGATDELTQGQSFQPDAAFPFIKLKSVETVSVTTAVPVHFFVQVLPPGMI